VKYFVRKKMREDSQWQKVTVIFSGAEVPGEGEHKIMLYIRAMKMQHGMPSLFVDRLEGL
jgi:5'-3' exonuclease